jgi:hypothetical protein
MERSKFEKYFLAPIITATIAIVGWSLINIIELKEEVATVKTDIKHIVKGVDQNSETLTRLSEKISLIDSFPPQYVSNSLQLTKNVKPANFEQRDWGLNEPTE